MNSTKKFIREQLCAFYYTFMSLFTGIISKDVSATDAMIISNSCCSSKARLDPETVIAAELMGSLVSFDTSTISETEGFARTSLFLWSVFISYTSNYESAVTALEESLKNGVNQETKTGGSKP